MPKRKASEEADEAPPKTISQRREEARARAREWADKEKAKKKTTIASAHRPSKPAPKPAPTSKPEPAAKKQKLNSGEAAKPTKKQMMEEARARAQAWAEQERAKKIAAASSSSNPTAHRTTPKRAPRTSASAKKPKDESAKKAAKEPKDEETKQQAAGVPPAHVEAPNASTKPSQGTLTPEVHAALMKAQQESMARAQMENAWAANNYYAQMATMAPRPPPPPQHMLSPQELEMHRLQQQVMENAGIRFMPQFNYMNMASPPMNAPPRPANMVPPPPMNSPQPSFASPPSTNVPFRATSPAAENKSPIRNAPSPEAVQQAVTAALEPPKEQEHPPIEQDDEVKESERSNFSRWLTIGVPFLLLSVIVAVASSMAFISVEEAFIMGLNKSVHKEPGLPPCFHSFPVEDDEEIGKCDRSKGRKPCPYRGVCSGGELRSCDTVYYDVSESLDRCSLSAASNETLAKVEKVLAGWTVEQTCKLEGCAHAIRNPDAIAPFFDISVVADAVNVSESTLFDLIPHRLNVIQVSSGKDGDFIVGLTNDYMEHKLVVPTLCYVGLWLVWFMEVVVKSFWGATHWASGWALTLTIRFPLATVMVLLMLWVIISFRKHRRQRQQLKQDVANIRQLVYAKLMEDVSKEFIVIFLRDEVAMDEWPTSKSNRTYIISKVWPRVVADVKHDNRVKKSTLLVQGTRRDVWQWTASTKQKDADKTN